MEDWRRGVSSTCNYLSLLLNMKNTNPCSLCFTQTILLAIQKDPENRNQSVSDGTKQNKIWFAPVRAHVHSKNSFGHLADEM